MAIRFGLSKFFVGRTLNRPQKSPSKPLCSIAEKQESTYTTNSTANIQTQVQEQARHENVQELQALLRQGRTQTARRLIRSMIQPNSPFSSPSHLYTLFSLSSPSMKHNFSDMLFSICSESKMVAESAELYMLMKKDGVWPSVESLNLFLQSLVSTERFEETLHLFSDIVEESRLRPNQGTYAKAIEAAVKLGDLKRGIELMNRMKRVGISPGVFVYNVLIGGLCKEKKMKDADKLFVEMLCRKVVPNRITYNTLIDGYSKVGLLDEALNIRKRMKVENLQPTIFTFKSLLYGLFRAQRMEEAYRVLEEMEAYGFVPDRFTRIARVDGFLKSSNEDASIALSEEARRKGVQILDHSGKKGDEGLSNFLENGVDVFNTILYGYCQVGDIEKAYMTIEKMEALGLRPNHVTYNSLVKKLCEMRNMEELKKCVETMVEKGLPPNVQTYNALINCCVEHGDVEKAFSLHSAMEADGVEPDRMTYNCLILGHFKEGMVDEVKHLVDDMKTRELIPNAETYEILIEGHCKLKDFSGAYIWYIEMLENGVIPRVSTCKSLITGLREEGRSDDADVICSEINNLIEKDDCGGDENASNDSKF